MAARRGTEAVAERAGRIYTALKSTHGRHPRCPGSAGVGKTLVISHIIDALEAMGRVVQLTATTGIAALNLNKGGMTVHSFSGRGAPAWPGHAMPATARTHMLTPLFRLAGCFFRGGPWARQRDGRVTVL